VGGVLTMSLNMNDTVAYDLLDTLARLKLGPRPSYVYLNGERLLIATNVTYNSSNVITLDMPIYPGSDEITVEIKR